MAPAEKDKVLAQRLFLNIIIVCLKGNGESASGLASLPGNALSRALDHVSAARAAVQAGELVDLVAIDVSAAVHALGEITGQTASEDLVETIFSTFCIGK